MASESNTSTKILPCNCVHTYQDNKYGLGKRVHTKALSKGGGHKWRCTVCSKEKL